MKNQKQSVRNVVALVAVLFSMVGAGLAEARDPVKAAPVSTKVSEVPTAAVNPQVLNPRPVCQNRVVPEGLQSVSSDLYCCAVTDRTARLSCLERNTEKTRAIIEFLSGRVNETLSTAINPDRNAERSGSYGGSHDPDIPPPSEDSRTLIDLIEMWEDALTHEADLFSVSFAEFEGLVDEVRTAVRR
jgi:hypothetical protein